MGQTQQTSFDINSDFTDVPEVSEKGVECFNGNIDEHEHAKNVENTIDSDHLWVVVESSLNWETWVVGHAESKDVPKKLEIVSFL